MTLNNCYVWDNAVIEDGVRASWAVVCAGARVRRGAVLEQNTVVSYNVQYSMLHLLCRISSELLLDR